MEQLTHRATFGFVIHPSQTLLSQAIDSFHRDLRGFLSSLAYHPPEVKKTTLDLRHLVVDDDSIGKKRFDVILLVCLTFNTPMTHQNAEKIRSDSQEQFHNLLSLHLGPYEFRVEALEENKLKELIKPFAVVEVIEIARMILNHKPFNLAHFGGNSTMTKIVDMLLREKGQYYLSVLLEPHQLSEQESITMGAFGYKGFLPDQIDQEILRAMPGLKEQTQAMFSWFRMKIRLVADRKISQYLINLVGSDVTLPQNRAIEK